MSDAAKAGGPRHVVAGDGDAGQRIDNFLIRTLKGVPRSHIYRILRRGEVRVNGGRIKATYRLQGGDDVRLPPVRVSDARGAASPSESLTRKIEESILYEDDLILAIDKPPGLAVHGGSGVSVGAIEALRALRPRDPELELVHRLDRDTSGVLLLAKRRSALRTLHEILREGRADKRYVALLCGRLRRDRVSVTVPLIKNVLRSGERVVRVDPRGKASRTDFRVLRRYADAFLAEAHLHTGRTHQIRVHAQYIGHPVAGDRRYGDDDVNRRLSGLGLRRLFLHAASIAFPWGERGKRLRIEAPLEPDLQAFLDRLSEAA
jgi:23S rRNA pseudouridine955/2504/2580 synthase